MTPKAGAGPISWRHYCCQADPAPYFFLSTEGRKVTTIAKIFSFPARLAAALRKEAQWRGTTESDLVRQAVARELGAPELAEMRRPGRPRKNEDSAATDSSDSPIKE